MNSDDTVKLLRECNSGIKMGISAIDDVFNSVSDHELSDILIDAKKEHEELESDLSKLMLEYDAEEKEPGVMAKTMSWIKTNVKLAKNESDKTVASLITDGCNMGIKSLHRYLNQYEQAENKVKDLVRKTINVEEHMVTKMRKYL